MAKQGRFVVYVTEAERALVDTLREGMPVSVFFLSLANAEVRRRFTAAGSPPKIRPRTTPSTHGAVPKYVDETLRHKPGPVTHIIPGDPEIAIEEHGPGGCEVCRPAPEPVGAFKEEP